MKFFSTKELINEALEPVWGLLSEVIPVTHEISHEMVHEVRVSIKRSLARVKLIDALVGLPLDKVKLVPYLKLLSHLLSARRDRDVLLPLLDSIMQDNSNNDIKLLLMHTVKLITARSEQQKLDINAIKKICHNIQNDYQQLPDKDIAVKSIHVYVKDKLAKICKQGTRVFKKNDLEKPHKWRKKVKYLYFQNEIISGADNKSLLPANIFEKLGKTLGEVNDMHVLKQWVQQQAGTDQASENTKTYDEIYRLFDNKIKHLLKHCRELWLHACLE